MSLLSSVLKLKYEHYNNSITRGKPDYMSYKDCIEISSVILGEKTDMTVPYLLWVKMHSVPEKIEFEEGYQSDRARAEQQFREELDKHMSKIIRALSKGEKSSQEIVRSKAIGFGDEDERFYA